MGDDRQGDTVASRVASHRRRLRESGLRPIQLWVPDTTDGEVQLAIAEMCEAIATYPGAADDQAFVEALVGDWE
jgi:hypothetical protein